MIFKIFLIVFALFALTKTLRQYRAQRVSKYWFTIWTLFWALVIFVAFLPQTTDVIANYVGVEKGADLLVYSAVVILTYVLYKTIAKQEKMDRDFTELTRHIAILEARKKESSHDDDNSSKIINQLS